MLIIKKPLILFFIFLSINTFAQVDKLLETLSPRERELALYLDSKIYSKKIAKEYFNAYTTNSGYNLELKLFNEIPQQLMSNSNEFGYRFAYWWNDGKYQLYGILYVNQYTRKVKFVEEYVSDNILNQRKQNSRINITAQDIKDAIEITTKLVELFKTIRK